jgi:hypothetical protein
MLGNSCAAAQLATSQGEFNPMKLENLIVLFVVTESVEVGWVGTNVSGTCAGSSETSVTAHVAVHVMKREIFLYKNPKGADLAF